ncbi:hypothetical protein V7S43_001678 [Phytophthora oleae]|uniref:Uncharacterized protein n=1 Tax=Phytophthora oleae TaxID=2107226 RepID=A0ABD3G4D5_9STRA
MAPDVTDGTVCGVDALLKTWALQSLCYDKIDLQPVRLENGPGNALVATTKGTLVINENTLRNAFPNLVSDGRLATLLDKMLGQQLELRGSVQFDWDSASARVTSIVCKADILTPLLRLLGSLDAVAYVFDNARLTPEGRLAPNESIRVT